MSSKWNPTLLFGIFIPIIFNLLTFRFILNRDPIYKVEKCTFNEKRSIDLKAIIGSVLFGLGVGMTGLNSETVFINFLYYAPISVALLGYALG